MRERTMHNLRLVSMCLLVVLAVSLATTVSAQQGDDANNAEARALYDAGAVAFTDGRFEDALERWQQAYALSPHVALLFNIGTAYDRLGRAAEAVEFYQSYLEGQPEAQNRNYVLRRIEILAVLAESQGSNEGAPGGEPPGEEVSQGEATDGTEATGESSDESTNEPLETGPEDSIGEGPLPSNESAGVPIGAVVTLGVGGAALIAGVVTGLLARGRHADLETNCPSGICGEEFQGDIDGLRRMTRATDALLIGGGVVAAGGLVWLLLGMGNDDGDDGAVRAEIGFGQLGVSGSF